MVKGSPKNTLLLRRYVENKSRWTEIGRKTILIKLPNITQSQKLFLLNTPNFSIAEDMERKYQRKKRMSKGRANPAVDAKPV